MSDNGLDFKPIISYTYSISILMINFKSFFHKYTYCTIFLLGLNIISIIIRSKLLKDGIKYA